MQSTARLSGGSHEVVSGRSRATYRSFSVSKRARSRVPRRPSPESGHHVDDNGHKRAKGSKVHLVVNALGCLSGLVVTPSNSDERKAIGDFARLVQLNISLEANDGVSLENRQACCLSVVAEGADHSAGTSATIVLPRCGWVRLRSIACAASSRLTTDSIF